MKISEKKILYKNYISTHFGKIHQDKDEYEKLSKYFKINYLKHLPADKNANIIDVGCGMGHFLHFLKKNGYINIMGVDISKENIEYCKLKGFDVVLCNIFEYLSRKNKTYDIIIMNDILEHFEKDEIIELLNIIYERIDSNGRLIIKVPNASNPILASSSRYFDFTHELLFTEESISQILKNASFNKVEIYPQELYVFYHNPLNYLVKSFAFMLHSSFRLIFCLYGRKTTKIFTKNIIAVASKQMSPPL